MCPNRKMKKKVSNLLGSMFVLVYGSITEIALRLRWLCGGCCPPATVQPNSHPSQRAVGMRNTTRWLPASVHACGPQVPLEEFQIRRAKWMKLSACVHRSPAPSPRPEHSAWTICRVLLLSLFVVLLASHLHLKSSRTKMNEHWDNKTNTKLQNGTKNMNKTLGAGGGGEQIKHIKPIPSTQTQAPLQKDEIIWGTVVQIVMVSSVVTVMVGSLWWLSWLVYCGDYHGPFTVVTVMVNSLWWLSWSVHWWLSWTVHCGDCHGSFTVVTCHGQFTVVTVMVSSWWWLSWLVHCGDLWSVYCGDCHGQFTVVIIRTELISTHKSPNLLRNTCSSLWNRKIVHLTS